MKYTNMGLPQYLIFAQNETYLNPGHSGAYLYGQCVSVLVYNISYIYYYGQ